MRRYQLKYHVVGGFSFYERAEIKDMISYLKVIHNPDDSISLLRVINTPVRGIGKATMEIIEQVALETGQSLWGAIGEAIRRQLLPQRALAAMKSFRDLIEDARAMLAGTYAERLSETATEGQPPSAVQRGTAPQLPEPVVNAEDAQIAFDPADFSFGPADEDQFDAAQAEPVPDNRQNAESDNAAFRQPGGAATPPSCLNSSSTAPATSNNSKKKTRPRLTRG